MAGGANGIFRSFQSSARSGHRPASRQFALSLRKLALQGDIYSSGNIVAQAELP
jgi:hypothetical protein